MKKENFKVGDNVFYMKDNLPKESKILGIVKFEGECDSLSSLHNIPKENEEDRVLFIVGSYTSLKRGFIHSSIEELKESVFSNPSSETE